MVSSIPIEERPRIRILQTKMRPNHFLMLLTKFLKILEKIAFAFITSHRTNFAFQVDQLLRQILSTNQSLSDEHSGSLTPRLLKHSNQIYIPEARTPDILKVPIR